MNRQETAILSKNFTDASMGGGEKSILQNYESRKRGRGDSRPGVDVFVVPRETRLPQPTSGSLS